MAQARLVRNGDVGDHRLSDAEFLASFRLPRYDQRIDTLQQRNPLPRESRIVFNEDEHSYTIDGKVRAPRSVTGLVHAYASHFDPYKAIECMRSGRNWEHRQLEFINSDGDAMTDTEIIELWSARGKIASGRGTLLHYHAEMLLNGCDIQEPTSIEFRQLLGIVHWLRDEGWRPYRTEICLMSVQLVLAGQADALFRNEHNDFAILDWKRSKKVQFDGCRRLLPPFDNLEDCNGWLYSLQLNVYRTILESEYGLRITMMALGQVHPELPSPRLVRVPRMDEEMAQLIEHQVEMCLAWPEPSPGENAPFVLPKKKGKCNLLQPPDLFSVDGVSPVMATTLRVAHADPIGPRCVAVRTRWAAVCWKSPVSYRDAFAGSTLWFPGFHRPPTGCFLSYCGGTRRFVTLPFHISTPTDTSPCSLAMADEVDKVETKRSRRLAEQTARSILDSVRIVTDSDVLLVLRQWAFRKNKSRKNVLPLGSDHVESDTLGVVAIRHLCLPSMPAHRFRDSTSRR